MSNIVVYVSGVFDLYHRGHVELLRRAKDLGTRLIVAVNSDGMASSYKRKPVFSEEDRLEIVRACRFVDFAFLKDGYDEKPCVLKYRVNKIVHGDDWEHESYLKQIRMTPEFIAEHGIEMVYLPYWRGISTTKVLTDAALSHKQDTWLR